MASFCNTKVFNFDEFLLIYFFLWLLVFLVLYWKSHWVILRSWRFTPKYFSLRVFSFMSYIYVFNSLWFDFCGWHKEEAQLHPFACGHPAILTHFPKECLFPLCMVLAPCRKLTMYIRYISGLYLFYWSNWSIFIPVPFVLIIVALYKFWHLKVCLLEICSSL